jgi:hypothetical protein
MGELLSSQADRPRRAAGEQQVVRQTRRAARASTVSLAKFFGITDVRTKKVASMKDDDAGWRLFSEARRLMGAETDAAFSRSA